MNKYIELIEKWLADNSSVSKAELRDAYSDAASRYPDIFATKYRGVFSSYTKEYDVNIVNAIHSSLLDKPVYAEYWINQTGVTQ